MEALTEEDVQKTINILTDMIITTFPGIQIVFAIGNHDLEPSNYQKFTKGEKTEHFDQINSWASTFQDPKDVITQFN